MRDHPGEAHPGGATAPERRLPKSLAGFIREASGWHQAALAGLSVAVFVLSTAPLEVQRRLVDGAVNGGGTRLVVMLALLYLGLALGEGALKYGLNVYRGWVSERAVRHLRQRIHDLIVISPDECEAPEARGIEISMILSEAEPVGGFVGGAVSEPLLQGGILVSVFAYMSWLEPMLALVSLAVFSPQLVFVPLIQHAINRRAQHRIQALREVSVDVIVPPRRGELTALIERVFSLNMQIYRLKYGMNFLMNLVHHVGVGAVLGLGGWYAAKGELEIGTVVAFVAGLVKLNDPWGDVINWFREMTSVRVKYALVVDAADHIADTIEGTRRRAA